MNKVFKVIWSEARNAYVVVSEMAKSHGTKSCSTKKLLAMLIATGVMTCASFDVLAEEPSAAQTLQSQYVAFAPTTSSFPDEYEQTIDGHKYIYDVANQYWVREGYILVLEPNGKLHTPLSANGRAADVAYTGGGDTSSILQSVTSLVSASGTVTNMGESLNSINASAYAGVSHSGGTQVAGTWNYIIEDSSWKDSVAPGNYKNGYVDLVDSKLPKGFKTAEDPNTELTWDDTKQCYTYKGNPVDYSNVYVIDGKIGVFTNKDGSKVYTGNVFGKNNEVLMTVKDANNKFYSYWASEVTDPSATMQTYRMADYEKDLSVLLENEKKLYRNDIKEVTLTKDENSATISLLRNGDTDAGAPVKGAISVSSGGGTGGSDTFVKISNSTAEQTFATGSKVEAVGSKDATTGLKINGEAYTIKSGSVVSVAQNAANKTTTITVDGTNTTITDTDTHNALASAKLDGKKLTITGKDKDKVEVDLASIDTDTKYTAGNGINISGDNNAIAVKLKEGENNLEVTAAGLALKKNLTVDSVKAGDFFMDKNEGVGYKGKAYITNSGLNANGQKITGVAEGTAATDAVNVSQLNKVSTAAKTEVKAGTNITSVDKTTGANGQDVYTVNAKDTTYTAGNGISISGENNAIAVNLKEGENNLEVTAAGLALKKALTVDSVKAGDFFMDKNEGVGYKGKAYITNSGLNANGQKITGVAEGTAATDAVNVSQLNKVSTAAKTEVKAGTNITSVDKTTGANGQDVYTVNAKDTTYTAGNGISISGEKNAIAVNLKEGENNLEVTAAGLALKKALTVDSVKAGEFYMSNAGIGYGGKAYITNSGLNANGQRITNVAAGTADTDAVNYGQLKNISAVAKTEVKAGTNITSVEKTTGDNGQDIYTVNAKDTTYTAGNGISISGENNAIAVKLKEGENNLEVTAAGLALKKALTVDSVKAGDTTVNNAGVTIGAGTSSVILSNSNVSMGGQQIHDVAAGTENTDAVNVGQLNKVSTAAKTEVKAGTNITSVEKTTGDNGQDIYTVNAKDTTYTAGNGISISGENNAIAVKLKEGENNLEVTADGLALKKALTVDSVKAGDFYMSNAGIGYGGKAYITGNGLNANGQTITNVADGVNNTDAVNVSQLKKVSDTANAGWNLSTGKGITNPTKIKSGATVDFSGDDENITVSKEETEFATLVNVKLNRNLNVDSVNAGDYFMSAERGIGFGGSAYITQRGLDANNNVISNVAADTADTDAVNVSQLKNTVANSGWKLAANGAVTSGMSEIKNNGIVNFDGDKNISVSKNDKDGITTIQVELNKDLSGIESISNGDAKMALDGAAGTAGMINGKGASIYMQDGYTVINSKVAFDQTGKISGVAAGEADTDAVNVGQLKDTVANSGWKLATNGVLTEAKDVKSGEYVDFNGDQNISVSNDVKDGIKTVKVELNKDLSGIESISNGDAKMALNGAGGTAGMINGKGASIYMQDGYTVINSKVAFDQTGKISGVAAGAITADSTDAVNGSQLHAVATEAGKHSKVVNGSNINVEETDVDGQKFYKVNLNKDIMLGDLSGKNVSISGTNGTIESTGYIATKDRVYADKGAKLADIDVTGNIISNGTSSIVLDGSNVKVNDKVTIDQNGKISGVAAGVADTDAVNVGQLKEAVEAGNTDTHIKPGEYGVGADNTVNMDVVDKNGNKIDTVTIKDVAKASDVGDVNNIADDIKNGEGKTTIVDAVNNLNNKLDTKVGDLQYSKVEKGDIADGDSTTTAIGKLDQKLTDVAATAAKHNTVAAGDNITVSDVGPNADGGKEYKVALKNKIDLGDDGSVTTGQTVMNNDGLKVGDKVSVSATAVTAGQTSISDAGVKVGDNTYISADGLNANNQKVTNVANGKVEKDSKDAINGGQLFDTETKINNRIDGVENQVINNSNRIGQLNSRVNKVGAGAAALAALHPMDFDPDDKLTFSAGYGNYAGQNAAAIGAYYRPDEKVMFSVGGTVGNGENMVNAGVSFALDRTNHVSNSRTALAREVIDLRGQLAVMGAKMAKMEKAFGMLDETKTKLFPDVPANHWAYEYIAKLAGNGYIEGYPDGSFGGDRLMTRYEFAAMLYRAIEKGAALEEKIIKEFEPELGRIRVERISGEDGDRNKIERVRVNDTKGERDHYGNKLAK